MTPRVDETRCIGCGLCVQLCSDLFMVDPRQIAIVSGVAGWRPRRTARIHPLSVMRATTTVTSAISTPRSR